MVRPCQRSSTCFIASTSDPCFGPCGHYPAFRPANSPSLNCYGRKGNGPREGRNAEAARRRLGAEGRKPAAQTEPRGGFRVEVSTCTAPRRTPHVYAQPARWLLSIISRRNPPAYEPA